MADRGRKMYKIGVFRADISRQYAQEGRLIVQVFLEKELIERDL
jgi:hypothetical protein